MIDANEAIQRVTEIFRGAGIKADEAQIWQVAHALLTMAKDAGRDERIAAEAKAKLRGRL